MTTCKQHGCSAAGSNRRFGLCRVHFEARKVVAKKAEPKSSAEFGAIGGRARAERMSPGERKAQARQAAEARWGTPKPQPPAWNLEKAAALDGVSQEDWADFLAACHVLRANPRTQLAGMVEDYVSRVRERMEAAGISAPVVMQTVAPRNGAHPAA